MTGRSILHLSLLIGLLLLASCSSTPWVSSISVTPATQTLTTSGATVQFKAIGTFSNRSHPQTQQDLTDSVTWTSSAPSVATISTTGMAMAVANGTTTITAASGATVGTATLTVTIPGGGGGGLNDLTALTIIPATGKQFLNNPGETAQYIAMGTFTGTPATKDMTDQVTWSSSDVRVATINSAGLATAVGSCLGGITTITALATSPSGAAIAGTSDLTVLACGVVNLPTLTVYEFGQGTGTVMSLGPNNQPDGVIDCGGGVGCTGTYPLNTLVTLKATPATGALFGGFSANCAPVAPDPNACNKEAYVSSCTCTVTMPNNETVGTVFNLP